MITDDVVSTFALELDTSSIFQSGDVSSSIQHFDAEEDDATASFLGVQEPSTRAIGEGLGLEDGEIAEEQGPLGPKLSKVRIALSQRHLGDS